MQQENDGLKKEVGTFTALATVMGTVIGGGVFFKVASVVSATQSAGITLIAWVLGGLLTICAGLTSAELAAALPLTGGAVKYLEYTYGKLPAYLFGWAQSLIYFPANIAALSIVFGTQIVALLHLRDSVQLPVAILAGLSITLINFLGTKAAGRLQSMALIFKLIPIAIIVLVGLFAPSSTNLDLLPTASAHTSLFSAFSSGLLATMFAYDGWLGVGAIAGEMKHPEKDLPRAIGWGLAFITIIYTLINLVFLKTLPISHLAGNLNAASESAIKLFGVMGGKLVTIGILISVYGAINGYTMTGMRVPLSMAEEQTLPFSGFIRKVSKHTAAPFGAGILQFAIALLMMFLGNFDLLTDMIVFVMWIFSLLIFIAVFILRKREPDLKRPYRVPGYPVIPIIAIVGGLFILITTIVTQFELAMIGMIVTLLGVPVYYLTKKYYRQ
ncbi:APC family permease [Pediococcus parvulus]|jgi:APA family basic amino acid/polyamine antiporter|uniref:APC family permease n=1 Tax=Pediococcus parvulus TaxID=54062 RepID=UPI00071008A4|nr:amino acid permease [Pediococcus parvulus]MCT3026934.1 amino acid permease [Pediococcus parvulus]MCT3034584.1 amino acid permease [Pediococcus parvulus]GEL88982.1 amino acid permease [Pediococcus parvulus]GHC03302.1 amino acid permease [Pediococcus parvulus]